MPPAPKLALHPLTPERWPDLVRLFGSRGACAGCWCTWWRLPRARFDAGRGGVNRRREERYVRAGNVPGLLAYVGGEPVGWVAIEPRAAYPRLARARTLAPVDDAPVWSITCFFVARPHRGKGLTRALIEGAVRHARSRGARIVEAYPVDVDGALADASVYTGAASTFRALGFAEVARRSPTRPILRRALGRGAPRRPARRGGRRAT
jgi:GNAT superfamily N-acetyltransferase